MTNTSTTSCPPTASPMHERMPFSPLSWSVWRRLGIAACVCAALWAAVLWALD